MITVNSNGQPLSADFISALTANNRTYDARLIKGGSVLDCSITSITITKGSCGSSNAFTVGNIVGSTLVARVQGLNDAIKGEDIKVQIGLQVDEENETFEYVTLGTFTVSEAPQNVYSTTITAYGATITRTGSAFNVPATKTLANIASSIAASVSALAGRTVTVTFGTGIIDSDTITADMSNLTVYQALQILAGVVGGFVIDTYDGNIKICRFDDTPTITRDTDTMINLPVVEEEDFEVNGVICITAPATETTPASQFPATPTGNENLMVQNKYVTQALYNSYLATLAGYTYRPANIGLTYGDPRLEGDDVVQVTDINEEEYVIPCHMLTHVYTGAFSTQVVSADATEEENGVATSAGSLTEQISNIGASAISARASAESAKRSADAASAILDDMEDAAEAANTTLTGIYADAETAKINADQAIQDANSATESAISANGYARAALSSLSDVEQVVDVLGWVSEHGIYSLTSDIQVDPNKSYYRLLMDTNTYERVSIPVSTYISDMYELVVEYSYFPTKDETVDPEKTYYRYDSENEEYEEVVNPVDAELPTYFEREEHRHYVLTTDTTPVSGKDYYAFDYQNNTYYIATPTATIGPYYELSFDESIRNYILTHMSLDDQGLWVFKDDNAYRILITGSDVQIKNNAGKTVASYGSEIEIGSDMDSIRNVITSTRMSFRTNAGDIAYFGLNDDGIWEMHISTTYADDMIRFGNYAWIKRDNGNMTIKWLGEVT